MALRTLYVWGSTENGELGVGGVEDEHIVTPREMDWPLANKIEYISCGSTHSLMLTDDGKVYSCGCNDFGQLGHQQPRKRPPMSKFYLVEGLNDHVITKVCCGTSHSVAINEWGNLFTFLGHDLSDSVPIPKLVKALGTKHIIQIATGNHHNIALTNEGELYAWGLNNSGQCGIGDTKKVSTPTKIISLNGIPIAFIACGGSHSFAISKSGAVFGFGKNTFGQLGIGDCVDRIFPTQLKTLRSLGVRCIAAGEDFSVFLTQEGGVLTCGAGSYGQLGNGNKSNDVLPRMVFEMMGTTRTQVACGGRHVLTFVPSRGCIYGFGLGSSGQLGNRSTNNSLLPQIVVGPWAAPNGSTLLNEHNQNVDYRSSFVKRIFSGGDHSFASTTGNHEQYYDSRIHESGTQIECMSVDLIKLCASVGENDSVDLSLMTSVEIVFKNLACMNGSFLSLRHNCCSRRNHGLNIEDAKTAFGLIQTMENRTLKGIIWDSVTTHLLPTLISSPPDVEALRIYLLLPLYHEFINVKNFAELHTPFAKSLVGLEKNPKKIISQWFSNVSLSYFEQLIENFKNAAWYIITNKLPKAIIKEGPDDKEEPKAIFKFNEHLASSLDVLQLLYDINRFDRDESVPCETFYLHGLSDVAHVQQDFCDWYINKKRQVTSGRFLFNYPFVYDASTKKSILQLDQHIQMNQAMAEAQTFSLMSLLSSRAPVNIYIVFNISRDNIVEDTITEIMRYGASELKKPLKIKFKGEEAEDAGGVQKEFFMLLTQKLFSTEYGMFKYFEESRFSWFSDTSFEGEEMFSLVGTLVGLAIYNFLIINLPFPLALYKKILKEPLKLSDLCELSPTLGNSLKNLLEYEEDDMEEVFDLTFEVTREVYGELETVPLKTGGDKIQVNQSNKKEFVDLYIDYVFNESVEKQFNGFYEGFMKVCGTSVLSMFRAYELRLVVTGNEEYDWEVFENNAAYKEGYKSSDLTIRLFWEVFHELPLEEKKKFLLFLTGSDRIPMGGMKEIPIKIQPVSDDKFLPVAHTCFNLLDLPRYQTKEKLKYKLLQAIQHNQRFSLV